MDKIKSTGIIRRVDDLGRVVIPREIRRELRIHEGDPLEISFIKEAGRRYHVCLTPYRSEERFGFSTLASVTKILADSCTGRDLAVAIVDNSGVKVISSPCWSKDVRLEDVFKSLRDEFNTSTTTAEIREIPDTLNGLDGMKVVRTSFFTQAENSLDIPLYLGDVVLVCSGDSAEKNGASVKVAAEMLTNLL